MRSRVFVTRPIMGEGLDLLKQECEVRVNPFDRGLAREEMLQSVREVAGVLCSTDSLDEEIMNQSPYLRIISNHGAGYNNVDVDAATKRKIMVTNTPGVVTETAADLTWSLLMSVARRTVEADRFIRKKTWEGWPPNHFMGTDIHHATLGIIGFGKIGRAVARRAMGFSMKILYSDIQRAPRNVEDELGASFSPLEKLLENSDFVTLHLPFSPAVRHMISEKELKLMKKNSYLINAARGPLVDEEILVQALREEWIAGAGLDVYEHEPELTAGLSELDNVVLLPHIGSATVATRTKMAVMAASNLLTGLRGGMPPNLVNREILEK